MSDSKITEEKHGRKHLASIDQVLKLKYTWVVTRGVVAQDPGESNLLGHLFGRS
jgi:hypothetical protein